MAARKKSKTLAMVPLDLNSLDVAPIESKYAERFASKVPVLSENQFLSTKGGKFSFNDNNLGKELNVVVLDYIYENALFLHTYDPDNIESPACFALSDTQDELKPHETAPEPCSDSCLTCDNNVFGSAQNGKGKACRNTLRVAVVAFDTLTDPKAQVLFLRISPSGLNAWAKVLSFIQSRKTVPYQYVMKLSVVDLDMGFTVEPELIGGVPESVISNVESMLEANEKALRAPPKVDAAKEDAKPVRGVRKKAAAKKKSAAKKVTRRKSA